MPNAERTCLNCKNLHLDFHNLNCKKNCDIPNYNDDRSNWEEINEFIDTVRQCEFFESKYIEYPLEVNDVIINSDGENISTIRFNKNSGKLARIRYCKDDKTYLGFYLGEAVIQNYISYNNESKVLEVNGLRNPALFVPELGRVIYGCESWWCIIESEEDFKEITDEDIDNTWYVQLAKDMFNKEDE